MFICVCVSYTDIYACTGIHKKSLYILQCLLMTSVFKENEEQEKAEERMNPPVDVYL